MIFSVDIKKPSSVAESSEVTEPASAPSNETPEDSSEEEEAGNSMTAEVQCEYLCRRRV